MLYDIEQYRRKYSLFRVLKEMLKELMRANKLILPFILVYTLAVTFINYFPVYFQRTIIDVMLKEVDLNLFYRLCVIYFISMLIAAFIMHMVKGYNEPRFSLARINYMTMLLNKQLKIDYKYMEDAEFQNNLERALRSTWGNHSGIELTFKMLNQLPPIFISIVLLTLLILMKNPLIVLGIFLNVAGIFYVKKLSKDFAFKKKKDEGEYKRKIKYFEDVSTDFSYGKDLRIYSLSGRMIRGMHEEIEKYVNLLILIKNREFFYGLITLFTTILCDALTYGILLKMAFNGMDIAEFSQILTASVTLSLLLKNFFELFANLYEEGLYVDEALNFVEQDLGDKEKAHSVPFTGTLDIEFKNVSFTYPRAKESVFDNISFKINKGEKLAIVGVNGAGKTTLVKLLTGLFRPTSGKIFINGIDSESITKNTLYKMFSAVFQEVNIQPFSIKFNVASTKKDVDEAKVWDALEKVGLKDKVEAYEQKLDQKLNKVVYEDGTELSGGEAQKLSIARAIYKDANMVIMDEPTSALDALAEQEIYTNFNDLIKGKTALYISHRLASTKFCDRIILLDGKNISEEGSHQELMEKRGKYFEMFTIQGKYYNQENNDKSEELENGLIECEGGEGVEESYSI